VKYLPCGAGITAALILTSFTSTGEELNAGLEKRIDVIVSVLDGIAPPGYTVDGPIERYNVGNIYDKINGRSELHMAYGLVGMAFARVAPDSDDGAPVEVYLYDMGTVLGAFGAYSVERWAEGDPVEVGREGYRHRDDLNFWHGAYYVNVVGRENDAPAEEAQLALAKALVDRLEDGGETLWGLDWLPGPNRVPHSVQYFMVDALSLDFLTDTFTAKYSWDGEEITVFVSRQRDEAQAEAVMGKLREYHERYSASVAMESAGELEYLVANIGGSFHDVAARSGEFVFGVTTVEGREEALAAMVRLQARINQ
jgi:hypothetical protein